MTDQERLSKIREFGLQLRSDHEFAEARIPPLNRELQQLSAAGLIPVAVYWGDIILSEPYEAGDGSSGRAYLAALTTSRGIGVVQLDTDERLDAVTPSDIELRFLPFDDLPARVQARLGSQVTVLLEQLMHDLHLA